MKYYLGICFSLIIGFFAGFIFVYSINLKTDIEEDIFSQTQVIVNKQKLVKIFYQGDMNEFRTTLICNMIEEDKKMSRLSKEYRRKGYPEKNLYGGGNILNLNSRYVFDDLGLQYDEYKNKCNK